MAATVDLHAELNHLREEREAALMRIEVNQLRAMAGQQLLESYGDWVPSPVDTRAYLYDDPSFGYGSRIGDLLAYTSIDDRKEGRFRPVYETEQDLAGIRGAARNLITMTGIRTGALDTLANYTLAGGYDFKANPENENDPFAANLAAFMQQFIKRFLDDNDFNGVIDREAHLRSREDGEALIAFDDDEIKAGRVICYFIEPDQLTEPANSFDLEEWEVVARLTRGNPSCWKFGVHTPAGKTWKPLGYHIVRDNVGRDWDYIPAYECEHIKRNGTRNAKRGFSDFFEVANFLVGDYKLARNMLTGGALQAAIAWIVQGAQGQTKSQLENLTSGQLTSVVGARTPTGEVTQQRVNGYPAATTLRVGYGQEYLPGPMGAERNQGFEVAGQYALRHVGIRWCMPEYMISGDASNANYSSTLVAESPFVKAREADQRFYSKHFISLIWKAMRIYFRSGRFARFGIGCFEDIQRMVRIDAECPNVASRDPKVAVDSDIALKNAGVMSQRTLATRHDLDFDKEQKEGATEALPPMQVGPNGLPLSNPGFHPEQPPGNTRQAAVQGALESTKTTDEAKAVLAQLTESYP